MSQRFIPAAFIRGGSSKGVFFHAKDLPADRAAIDPILLGVLGSPDPNGRQLDGMGGGISSLSKGVIIGPPTHAGGRCGLHLRPGRGGPAGGGLEGQLRQPVLRRRPLRGG